MLGEAEITLRPTKARDRRCGLRRGTLYDRFGRMQLFNARGRTTGSHRDPVGESGASHRSSENCRSSFSGAEFPRSMAGLAFLARVRALQSRVSA